MDMYNNVLVFIVGGGTDIRSEMHIFQVSVIFYNIKKKYTLLQISTITFIQV